jgi:hypothetical protein
VHLDEVEKPLLPVVMHSDLHYMEEIGVREVADDTGNLSKNIEYSANMVQREFGIGSFGVGIAEHSI